MERGGKKQWGERESGLLFPKSASFSYVVVRKGGEGEGSHGPIGKTGDGKSNLEGSELAFGRVRLREVRGRTRKLNLVSVIQTYFQCICSNFTGNGAFWTPLDFPNSSVGFRDPLGPPRSSKTLKNVNFWVPRPPKTPKNPIFGPPGPPELTKNPLHKQFPFVFGPQN